MKEVLTFTNAPESYDGFGTRTLKPIVGIDRQGKPVRLVSTPLEHYEWQRMRYRSGLYLAASPEEWGELCLARIGNRKMDE